MTLQELSLKYSFKDLESIPGDTELRYKLFSPFLTDLYENKIIYYERFMCIAILEDIKITSELFSATAKPYIKIKEAGSQVSYFPENPWTFGTVWSAMRLRGDHFGTYSGWLIWPEKQIVKMIEGKAKNSNLEEALKLTLYK